MASSPSVTARTVTGTMMVTTWTWTLGKPRSVYAVALGVQRSSGPPSPGPSCPDVTQATTSQSDPQAFSLPNKTYL